MASYVVNDRAVAHCRKLIDARRYVLGDVRRVHRMGLIACMYRAAE